MCGTPLKPDFGHGYENVCVGVLLYLNRNDHAAVGREFAMTTKVAVLFAYALGYRTVLIPGGEAPGVPLDLWLSWEDDAPDHRWCWLVELEAIVLIATPADDDNVLRLFPTVASRDAAHRADERWMLEL